MSIYNIYIKLKIKLNPHPPSYRRVWYKSILGFGLCVEVCTRTCYAEEHEGVKYLNTFRS